MLLAGKPIPGRLQYVMNRNILIASLQVNKRSPVMAVIWILAGMATAGAETLPIPSCHHDRALRRRWAHGLVPVRCGWHGRFARPTRHYRKRRRGGGQHRGRQGGPRPTGRFHYQLWRLADARYNGAAYSLSYDVFNDFEPVAMTASAPWLLVAKKDMPGDDLKSLIAWLKANPDKASVGHGGVGSASHSIGVLFRVAAGAQFQLVPYRGNGAGYAGLDSRANRHDV